MTATPRLLTVLVTAAAVATVAGCGSSSSGGSVDAATTTPTVSTTTPAAQPSQPSLTLSTTTTGPCPKSLAGHPLPADIPQAKHAVVYNYGTLGKTRVWFLSVPGGPSTLQQLRDSYDAALTSHGYTVDHTDQEEGHEAEAEFHGPHAGTTNFRGLCTGRASFRLKLTK